MKRSGLIMLLFGLLAFGCANALTVTFQGTDAHGQPLANNSNATPAMYLVVDAKFDNNTLADFFGFAVKKLPEVGLICDEFTVNKSGQLEVQGQVVPSLNKKQAAWWNVWFTKYCAQINDGVTLLFNNKDFLVKNTDTDKALLMPKQKNQIAKDIAKIPVKLKPVTQLTKQQFKELLKIISYVHEPVEATRK